MCIRVSCDLAPGTHRVASTYGGGGRQAIGTPGIVVDAVEAVGLAGGAPAVQRFEEDRIAGGFAGSWFSWSHPDMSGGSARVGTGVGSSLTRTPCPDGGSGAGTLACRAAPARGPPETPPRRPAAGGASGWHPTPSAGTRRCPAGRRSRSPVSSLGAGADNGPIAASSAAACLSLIHI